VHPDEARSGREDRPDEEAERGPPAELVVEAEQEERSDRDDRDGRVLLAEVCRGALLHGARDLLHPLAPGRLLQQPPGEVEPAQDRYERAHERQRNGVIYEEVHVPPVLPVLPPKSPSQTRVGPFGASPVTKKTPSHPGAGDYVSQGGGAPRRIARWTASSNSGTRRSQWRSTSSNASGQKRAHRRS